MGKYLEKFGTRKSGSNKSKLFALSFLQRLFIKVIDFSILFPCTLYAFTVKVAVLFLNCQCHPDPGFLERGFICI